MVECLRLNLPGFFSFQSACLRMPCLFIDKPDLNTQLSSRMQVCHLSLWKKKSIMSYYALCCKDCQITVRFNTFSICPCEHNTIILNSFHSVSLTISWISCKYLHCTRNSKIYIKKNFHDNNKSQTVKFLWDLKKNKTMSLFKVRT